MKKTLTVTTLAASCLSLQAATIVWDNAAPGITENIVTDSSVVIGGVIGAWNFTGTDTTDYTTTAGATFKAVPLQGIKDDANLPTVTSGSMTLTAKNSTHTNYGNYADGRNADYWAGPSTDAGFESVMDGYGGIAAAASTAFELSGLTAETAYRIQFFYSSPDNTASTGIDIDNSATDGFLMANPDSNDLGHFITGTLTTGVGETSVDIDLSGKAELNAMVLAAVPEPSSAALLGLGGLALILRRRK